MRRSASAPAGDGQDGRDERDGQARRRLVADERDGQQPADERHRGEHGAACVHAGAPGRHVPVRCGRPDVDERDAARAAPRRRRPSATQGTSRSIAGPPQMPMPARASRRSRPSRMRLPRSGPMAMPRKVAALTRPMARDRAWPAYRWLAPAVASGTMAPAPAPWTARARTICSSDWDAPDRSDPSAKMASAPIISRGRPAAVGGAAGQRRGRDVGDEIGGDDPGGAPQVRPSRRGRR